MKIVILCGGRGSRLGGETDLLPKPMVKIGNKPILLHIMNLYKKAGFNDFILAVGYKGKVIFDYFKKNNFNYKVKVIDTGLKSLTGGRILKLKRYLKNEKSFMLTYGDGLSDQNLKKLVKFHKKHNKIGTMTVVRPPVRFGEVVMKNEQVIHFEEKPQIKHSWINGGFFIFNSGIFKYLSRYNEMLEQSPLKKLTNSNQLMAYKHYGFWQCMDTARDKELLTKLIKNKKAEWLKKK